MKLIDLSYLLCTLLSAAGLGVCLILYVDFSRRSERARLAEQTAQNERLKAIVERKTRELTAIYKAQSEMSQVLERKKRVETIGLLAGNVAHDINNLLQVIANSNEALADLDSDASERKRLLDVSNALLRHGSGIIKQLFAYSRRQELSAQSVPIQEYLSECRSLFHSAVGDRNLLTIEDKSGGSSIFVDPSQLTTTLLSILSNAADSMPNGRQINLSTSRLLLSDMDSKDWNGLKPGDYLHFRVADTGCGMNSEQLSRAFEPFFTTKVEGKGTGLGLSSVYGFVKQSGGEIKLKSEPGVGTKVEFLLPLSVSTKSAPAVPAVAVSNALENKRLLLVEDHEAVAKSLTILLSRLKLQCQWVISGQEAIEVLKIDSKFDFVLSDVHMPGSIDGLALTRWIKAELPEIKALLMSGFHDIPFEDFESPVLPKPFNLRQLASFLTEHSV